MDAQRATTNACSEHEVEEDDSVSGLEPAQLASLAVLCSMAHNVRLLSRSKGSTSTAAPREYSAVRADATPALEANPMSLRRAVATFTLLHQGNDELMNDSSSACEHTSKVLFNAKQSCAICAVSRSNSESQQAQVLLLRCLATRLREETHSWGKSRPISRFAITCRHSRRRKAVPTLMQGCQLRQCHRCAQVEIYD
jgi:hypothetical protein